MAKQQKSKVEKGIVHYGKFLTTEQKRSGIEYTFNWANVTNPEHLKMKSKADQVLKEEIESQETPGDSETEV